MSDRIDYRYNAEERIKVAVTHPDETQAQTTALIAQAEATLALVEQQRIANHIAYVVLLEAQYAEAAAHPGEFQWETRAASEERHGIALDRIREGLGL